MLAPTSTIPGRSTPFLSSGQTPFRTEPLKASTVVWEKATPGRTVGHSEFFLEAN
jgi:hypothetical protein